MKQIGSCRKKEDVGLEKVQGQIEREMENEGDIGKLGYGKFR